MNSNKRVMSEEEGERYGILLEYRLEQKNTREDFLKDWWLSLSTDSTAQIPTRLAITKITKDSVYYKKFSRRGWNAESFSGLGGVSKHELCTYLKRCDTSIIDDMPERLFPGQGVHYLQR